MVAWSSRESSNSSVTVCGEPPPMLYTILASPPAVKSYSWMNGNTLSKSPICPSPNGAMGTTARGKSVRVLFSLITLLIRGPVAAVQAAPASSKPGVTSALLGKYTPTVSENPPATPNAIVDAPAASQPSPKSKPTPDERPATVVPSVSAAFAIVASVKYAYQLPSVA